MKRQISFFIVSALLVFQSMCMAGVGHLAAKQKIIQLTGPETSGTVSLEWALSNRRSIRQFTHQPVSSEDLGQLLWAGQGITDAERGLRTAPSAGALYPLKLYVAKSDGVFEYNPQEHILVQQSERDVRKDLSKAALGQQVVEDAPCDIIIAGSVRILAVKYHNRARKFLFLEAGHAAQNILLQAVARGLGAVPVGAFAENLADRIITLPVGYEPLYILSIGHPSVTASRQNLQQQAEQKKKRAALIIASDRFRDEELFETRSLLQSASIETTIVSSKLGEVTGTLGGTADAEVLLKDLVVDDFDAIVFIGGEGARQYFNDQRVLAIARLAKQKNKVLAAICIAPNILANAGLLDGVDVTGFASIRVELRKAGANYTGADVEKSGNIITAKGPKAAAHFAEAIAKTLKEQ